MVDEGCPERSDSFEERLKFIEELLQKAESLLDEVLGRDEEEESQIFTSSEENSPELFELFAEMLLALREKEENTLKAPWSRWKFASTRQTFDWEKITLPDLFALYHVYLAQDGKDREIPIDDSFERLLLERRARIRKIVEEAQGGPLEMSFFFQDCRHAKSTIATFLVLLDLVFHKELRMITRDQGKIYFERNGEIQILEESP